MEEISLENEKILCEFCGREFTDIDNLRRHMIIYKRYPGHQKDRKDFKIEKLEYEVSQLKKQLKLVLNKLESS
jgi:hypothetical protein